MKIRFLLPFALIPLILSACRTQSSPTGTLSVTVISPTSDGTAGYPAPGSQSPYPAGENPDTQNIPATPIPQDPASLPTPDPNLGSVRGVLIHNLEDGNQPVANAILYLAHLLTDSQGNESVASYNRIDSPKTITGAQGEFAFINIEPGRYALVLDTVTDSFLLSNPENGEDLIATVVIGEVYDLGELVYEGLPIPQ